MADNKEENKKGGIVKIAIFAAAGWFIAIGLGIGALYLVGEVTLILQRRFQKFQKEKIQKKKKKKKLKR